MNDTREAGHTAYPGCGTYLYHRDMTKFDARILELDLGDVGAQARTRQSSRPKATASLRYKHIFVEYCKYLPDSLKASVLPSQY